MTQQRVITGDCLAVLRTLPESSVHCCVTSPPYWGLRDYGREEQIGLEPTPDAYVARLVEVFREVRRVLRDDGTLWLNLGDSYAAARGGTSMPAETLAGGVSGRGDDVSKRGREAGYTPHRDPAAHKLKHKDLVGIPWRVAFALQADGWYLRQDIVWAKPNPMPESVRDRCTKAHEYLFLLAKSERYFFDAQAISEPSKDPTGFRYEGGYKEMQGHSAAAGMLRSDGSVACHSRTAAGTVPHFASGYGARRNRRSVWTVTTKPYGGAHFAVMPSDLVEPCIKAGTSEEGCCSACGAPVARVVDRERVATRPGADTKVTGDTLTDGNRDPKRHVTHTRTTGWAASCQCDKPTTPCVVLDPFAGSGTTLAVAASLGRNAVGIELNDDYVELANARITESRQEMALFEGTPIVMTRKGL